MSLSQVNLHKDSSGIQAIVSLQTAIFPITWIKWISLQLGLDLFFWQMADYDWSKD